MENSLCEEVINESNDAIIFRHLDGTITFWNKGATELYGWTDAEAIGKKTHSLLHTQFSPVTLETTVLALENKGRWDGTLLHTTKSGNLISVASHQIFLKDKDTVLEINRSVVADKQTELLTIVMNSIQQGIYVVDMLGRIVFFNAEIVRMLGPQTLYESAAERLKTDGFFLPDQKTPWPIEELPLQRIVHGGNASGGLMFVKNNQVPEGMWIMNYAYALRKSDGTLVGGVALLKEIIESSSKGLPAVGLDLPMLPM